ncbi:hypothetical protein AB0F99_03080 [Nocardia testacea]
MFPLALGLYGILSLAGGLAGDPVVIIVARAVQGIGGALLLPSILSLINTLFEEWDRASSGPRCGSPPRPEPPAASRVSPMGSPPPRSTSGPPSPGRIHGRRRVRHRRRIRYSAYRTDRSRRTPGHPADRGRDGGGAGDHIDPGHVLRTDRPTTGTGTGPPTA